MATSTVLAQSPAEAPRQALLRPLLTVFIALSVLTGLVYPLVTTGVAQALFPRQAAGSLIEQNGKVAGSALIGQSFSRPDYFWGRLSATSPMPYNAASSGGSNLGPRNPALAQAAKDRIAALKAADPGNEQPIPVDLVSASGSGLDPHISPAAALYQAARVARTRHMNIAEVQRLIQANTQSPLLGILGDPVVNVLTLNLALDASTRPAVGIH